MEKNHGVIRKEAEMVMDHMLRERHRMIPYLYTMNYRSYCENKPLISPMYYNWQECNEAYEKKNQYLFGTSLMVAPITAPRIEKINMAKYRHGCQKDVGMIFIQE